MIGVYTVQVYAMDHIIAADKIADRMHEAYDSRVDCSDAIRNIPEIPSYFKMSASALHAINKVVGTATDIDALFAAQGSSLSYAPTQALFDYAALDPVHKQGFFGTVPSPALRDNKGIHGLRATRGGKGLACASVMFGTAAKKIAEETFKTTLKNNADAQVATNSSHDFKNGKDGFDKSSCKESIFFPNK